MPLSIRLPESGLIKPAIILKSVVFPQPEGPRSVKNSPFLILISTEISKSSYFFSILFISRYFISASQSSNVPALSRTINDAADVTISIDPIAHAWKKLYEPISR